MLKTKIEKFSLNNELNTDLKSLFTEWCEASTTHGIPRIARARNSFLKIMWFIFFSLCSSVCIYNITNTFIDFITYKINVNIETINEVQTDFPAVSFCNLNPFKMSDPDIRFRIESIINRNNNSIKNLNRANLKIKVINNILKKEASITKNFGFNLSELLISCFFKSYPCKPTDFEPFYDYEFGNCFRFNGKLNNIMRTHANNPRGGLSLEFFVGNDSFLDNFYSNKRGIRILVHNQSHFGNNEYFIDLENKGYDLAPGFSTNLVVKRIFYDRYPKPNGKCVDKLTNNYKYSTNFMRKYFNNYNQTIYSQELCQKYALQSFLDKNCSCTDSSLKLNKSCISIEDVKCYESFFRMFDVNSYEDMNNECPLGKNFFLNKGD